MLGVDANASVFARCFCVADAWYLFPHFSQKYYNYQQERCFCVVLLLISF
jgi:hypothetical protein